jgi:hypothetical protein
VWNKTSSPGVRTRWSFGWRTSGCGLGVALALGALGCHSTIKKDHVTFVAPRSLEPYAVQLQQAQTVSADTLYTVYSQHLIQGATPDQRFWNRLMHVSGDFNGINRSLPGKVYLELRTHDDGGFVYAEMAAADPLTTSLPVVGTKLHLLCRCTGALAGSPILTECHRE